MRLWRKVAIFGAVLLGSGCVTPPVYDEGILTLDPVGFSQMADQCLNAPAPKSCLEEAWKQSIIGDFAAHGGGFYEKRGTDLDGIYLYSAESRSNILKWAKSNCK